MSNISKSEKAQLTSLKNNEYFDSCFQKLMFNQELDTKDAQFILSCAIIFFRYYNNDKRYKGFFNIAYYIILKYSIIHQDFKPLYDISLQIGFYPISNYILDNNLLNETYINEALINLEIKKRYQKDNYIETIEQFNRSSDIFNNINTSDIAYIAPTSFGKSSIIRDVIIKNDFNKIAIIVPTKSLIIQTYNDIRKLDLNYKLILHDEMYGNEDNFIGILTQERATRLINKFDISLDIMFIDEAHNLLNNDSRNHLLSRLIMLNYKRNNNQRLLYLSPLVNDIDNLKIKNTSEGIIYKSVINHNVKIFDTTYLDKDKVLSKFNRFNGELYKVSDNHNFSDYIIETSKEKNFIYNYKPKNVEGIARKISENIDESVNENLLRISNVISNEISNDIDLVSLVKKGIIYLHGKLPNILKEYLEYNYKDVSQLKFIIANSVILEGINFPIDNLYITSTRYLNSKDLNNLIGRVNRLNYVFQNSLDKLISDIHFVDSVEFTNSQSNMVTKIKLLRDSTFKDENKNPLLENYDIDKLGLKPIEKAKKIEKDEKLISATDFLINSDPTNLEERIKYYCIENNIDVFYNNFENIISKIIQNTSTISNRSNVVLTVYEVFIKNLETEIKDFELERLKNEKARNYYENYIRVTQLQGLKDKISNTLNYFITKSNDHEDTLLFIGSSFGEIIKPSTIYNNREYLKKVYVNLQGKNRQILANLAMVKIKLEEDFVSFKLKKLITFLYDFEYITKEAYYLAIYGSTDESLIDLTRIGLSPSITKILKENKQLQNIQFDSNGNLKSNDDFKNFMKNQSELFKFEVNKYVI